MRDAGGMDLSETGIGKERALFVSAVGSGHVTTARVSREIKCVAVTAGREHDGIAHVLINRTAAQIAGDDPFGVTIDDDQIEHLSLRKHLDRAGGDLPAERL